MVNYRWWFRILWGIILVVAFSAGVAFAQQATVTTSNWRELAAVLINTAGVALVVQLIKFGVPLLSDKYGWVLPILALVAGPAIAALQEALASALGYQGFDFSLIVAALTGGTAVAANQIYHQKKQGPTGRPVQLFGMTRRP